jgi:uncharacterized protein involved in outer membrane biogenesis
VKFWRSKRGLAVLIIGLLLVLFLVRPGANRLRARIVESIGLAIGRPVDVSSVHFRLLPRPGFDLENFVVRDDPEFSAEPIVRAQEVTAFLRVTSLLRGRLEIARLSLTEPSVNLVRNSQAHWNVESLLDRTSKTVVAPTSKSKLEKRPGFPYIEVSGGRVNLKIGAEKTPYALTDADFAFWQDSEDSWGMRLKAKPVRTDFNLSDTGLLVVDGSWRRAVSLRNTPVHFAAEWEKAQLGQATKLAFASDQGWRGTLLWNATFTGTPGDLLVRTTAAVDDFRRFDAPGGGDLQLAAQCSAHYSSQDQSVSKLLCIAPVRDTATLALNGSIANLGGPRSYDLRATAHNIPIQSLLSLVRHAKPGVPTGLTGEGRLSAHAEFRGGIQDGAVLEGDGETSDFRLTSDTAGSEMTFGTVPFQITSAKQSNKRLRKKQPWERADTPSPIEAHLNVGPFSVPLGEPEPLVIHGSFGADGYGLSLQGNAKLQKLLEMMHSVGVAAPQIEGDGWAKVDLQVTSGWSRTIPPSSVGRLQLHTVRADVRGFNQPLNIAAASLLFAADKIDVQDIRASVSGTSFAGKLSFPRHCETPNECPVTFELHADQIDMDRLNLALNPQVREQPWYHFLSRTPAGNPLLLTVHANGKLTVGSLVIRRFNATHVSAETELKNGKLTLSDVRADVWGGKHVGEWRADFTVKPPVYSGHGTFQNVSLDQPAQLMNDRWISGTASAKFQMEASGLSGSELLAGAVGTLQIDSRNAVMPHVVLAGETGPLQVRRLSAQVALQGGDVELKDGELETPSGIYQWSGTATSDRILNLKMTRDGAPAFNITGTLAEPNVAAASGAEAQAALKP